MIAMPDDEQRQRDLEAFEKHIMEAVQQRARQRRQPEPDRAAREPEKTTNRAENPLELPERHRAENAGREEERLRAITDQQRRETTRENVGKYYEAWSRALKKAYAMRYEMSPRIYERRIADRKTDERLIPAAEKEKMHGDAIREAVGASQMRMNDINAALPAMIDKTINDAARYTRDSDERIADAIRQRAAQRDLSTDKDRDR